MMRKIRHLRLAALAAMLALVVAACGGDATETTEADTGDGAEASAPAGDTTLRIAMGSPGEAQIAVWEAAKAAFEEANEGVTVELNIVDDDLYQTIGLLNLLNGGDAPDIYFEWAGARLESRYNEGFVADITSAREGELGTFYEDGAFNGMEIDGKTVMVPGNADVTTVVWYNVDIFNDLGLTPPTTWDEFLEVSAAIDAAGIIPIALGNKDLWPLGNFTSHIVSRVMGEEAYDAMLKGETPMDSPEVIAGLELVAEMAEAGIFNESVNTIDDNEGAQLFFQGQAAMHPIGSWLVSWAISEAPDLNFDYFNLPAIDGAGAQDSVIAVSTGYVVNANSQNTDLAIDFLTLWSSPEFTAQMVDAGGAPLATGALEKDGVDARLLSLQQMMQGTSALVAPPDVGYDLKFADALYAAQAEVLGGVATPAEAAAAAQAKLDS